MRTGCVWVVAEQWRGRLSEAAFELLALGREVADGLGAPLEAVLLGGDVKKLAAALGAADGVLLVEHPALADALPEPAAQALAQLAAERKPVAVLTPLTNVSGEIATLLGERLQAPVIRFARNVRVVDGRLEADCVLYGGKIEARVTPAAAPAILAVSPGARPGDRGRREGAPPVEEVAVNPDAPAVKLKRYVEPDAGGVDLTQQTALVGVGRGMQSQDNLELAEELAQALGGAVCGSRPVVDQGWLPLSRQVGKSGVTVKPRVYVAAGISGAPEHVEGMRGAGLILAINSDPGAPIFNIAHYGVVADALDILPALTEAVRAKKGR